jgi:hypothetical protein
MPVMPVFIGAFELGVDEEAGRSERFDAGTPLETGAVEAKLIVDECAFAHGDGWRSEDMKVEEGGRDAFEIERVREECKDFSAGAWDEEGSVEVIGHGLSVECTG